MVSQEEIRKMETGRGKGREHKIWEAQFYAKN